MGRFLRNEKGVVVGGLGWGLGLGGRRSPGGLLGLGGIWGWGTAVTTCPLSWKLPLLEVPKREMEETLAKPKTKLSPGHGEPMLVPGVSMTL